MKKKVSYTVILFAFIFIGIYFYQNKSEIFYSDQSNVTTPVKNETQLLTEKEIILTEKSFDPKNWVLTDFEGKKVDGSELFGKSSFLVLYLASNFCSPCLETEFSNFEVFASKHQNLDKKAMIITSFDMINEFRAFASSLKFDNVFFYNRTKLNEESEEGYASYFTWVNGEVGNIFIPRLGSEKELNEKYLQGILPLFKKNEEKLMLFIIDGVESFKPKSYISEPKNKIPKHIRMLNPNQGRDQYGEKGKNGVVIYEF